MEPHTEDIFEIREDGIWCRSTSWAYMGPQGKLLEGLAQKSAGRAIATFDQKGTALFVSPTFTSLARRMDRLTLDTFFRPMTDVDAKSVLLPVWVAPGAEMKFTWTPPPDMELFFIVCWITDSPSVQLRAAKAHCFLIARDASTKRTHLLPLPNLHNTGQICMGKIGAINDGVRSLGEQFDWAIAQFELTKWNADLLHDGGKRSQELLRFDPEGKQLPPLRPWRELSSVVNYSGYEFIATL